MEFLFGRALGFAISVHSQRDGVEKRTLDRRVLVGLGQAVSRIRVRKSTVMSCSDGNKQRGGKGEKKQRQVRLQEIGKRDSSARGAGLAVSLRLTESDKKHGVICICVIPKWSISGTVHPRSWSDIFREVMSIAVEKGEEMLQSQR